MRTSARPRNPRGEGERLRAALLAAAAEMLAEDPDVEHLSVRAVTARAGVSPTALYLQFADREALIEAVKTQCFAALGGALSAAAGAHADPDERAAAAGEAYLRHAAEHPGHYAVMFHGEGTADDAAAAPARSAGLAVFDLFVGVVAEVPGVAGEDAAREAATDYWLALHGRASIRRTMPWFPMSADGAFVRRQVAALRDR